MNKAGMLPVLDLSVRKKTQKHSTSLTTPFSKQSKLWSPSIQLIPRANKFYPNHLLPVWDTDRLSQRLI